MEEAAWRSTQPYLATRDRDYFVARNVNVSQCQLLEIICGESLVGAHLGYLFRARQLRLSCRPQSSSSFANFG